MAQQQVQKVKKIKIVGDYALGRTVGKGTFANVKQAIHQKTNEKVSIKVLHKRLITETRDKINLSRELRILKRVRHPNIAQLLQTFETNNNIYIVMQNAVNGQLFNMITQNKKQHYYKFRGRLAQSTASAIFQQLINAIQYLHSIGIAHRDIKPENILLDYQNNVKLIDFGLSNFYQKAQKLLTSCGSPCYAPPEMLVQQAYDPLLADIWSCGIVLYAMVCGFLPFEDKSTKVVYHKIKQGLYEEPKHMSMVVKDLLSKILKFNPNQRISINEIRKHPFCNPSQPISRGLMPSQTMKLDETIVQQMNELGYFSFKTDVQNHRNSSNTATYYLLLYKKLRQQKQSLSTYFNNQFTQDGIKSPYRSKSMILKKQTEIQNNSSPNTANTAKIRRNSIVLNNEQEEQFLDKIYFRNQKNLSENKFQLRNHSNIRVRKILG